MFISGITSGRNYQFKYAARNIHGTGVQSDSFLVIAATVPAKMNTPTVTLQAGLKYRITFIKPSSGGSDVPIDAYEIVLLKKDGFTFASVPECDGTSTTVKTNLYCDADLSSLVNTPSGFSLDQGD
jgi:hypothetical protein